MSKDNFNNDSNINERREGNKEILVQLEKLSGEIKSIKTSVKGDFKNMHNTIKNIDAETKSNSEKLNKILDPQEGIYPLIQQVKTELGGSISSLTVEVDKNSSVRKRFNWASGLFVGGMITTFWKTIYDSFKH